MKLPFLNKHNSSSSYSSNSSSTSSSSWPWPSCHQNPKTISFRATIPFTGPIHDQVDIELEPPPETTESIENVIKGLRSSERLIFESKGESNSILEEATAKKEQVVEEEEEQGFMFLSLESNDPYSDFKKSMEEMVEAHALHHDWKSLEKLLFQFLKVNDKTSHGFIFAAFVDLALPSNKAAKDDDVSSSRAAARETSCCISMNLGESPSSPLSFYTSCSSYSSSDETSSTSVFLPLSSLLEMDEKTN